MERMSSPPILPLEGGCHCGGVRFRVTSAKRRIDDCNCSICRKKAFLHWIVPRPEFEQLRGDELLGEYRFGTGVARHPCHASPAPEHDESGVTAPTPTTRFAAQAQARCICNG